MGPVRDSAMTALILGFFASVRFGWAQERPPTGWRPVLIVGAVASLVVAVLVDFGTQKRRITAPYDKLFKP